MVFAHDMGASLLAAVALANSAGDDSLGTLEALDAFLVEHRYTGRHDRTRTELASVQALRPRLRELLVADRDGAVALVNAVLAEHPLNAHLARHDDLDWHLHPVRPDVPLATRILVETAMAMVDLIRLDELSRLAICADPECDGVVLDLSRNRSRRFCSTTCTNRAAATAYRARQRQS
jgi:predicted RNA-binding Zn ribbon-like protein